MPYKLFKRISICLALSASAIAYEEHEFTVNVVGASNNTNTVFIDVEETAANSNCDNKRHFKIDDSNKNADRFFSLALAAQAQSKKMVLGYNEDDCLHGGIEPRVFKIKS
ncbi:hypothetical protein [Reinekea sp. G2M2-21]|uniref:hypothetical protein n=1 Tax=Reinekea sp. G2M2-21 TaxID=2788942 RepID=UPI0018AC52D9|nr:hypothetical protein [Reinekea sp. G2M2-21]